MNDTLQRLQAWYANQCNDDWEHQYGVKIDSLDNPGWSVQIDLVGTSLEGRPFAEAVIERTESDWINSRVTEKGYEGHGGVANLEELLLLFVNWAERR